MARSIEADLARLGPLEARDSAEPPEQETRARVRLGHLAPDVEDLRNRWGLRSTNDAILRALHLVFSGERLSDYARRHSDHAADLQNRIALLRDRVNRARSKHAAAREALENARRHGASPDLLRTLEQIHTRDAEAYATALQLLDESLASLHSFLSDPTTTRTLTP